MGKKIGSSSSSSPTSSSTTSSSSSWLTLVKRAFRSPTKDSSEKRSGCRRRDERSQEDEEKKREKRRWLFRKSKTCGKKMDPIVVNEQRHAIAVAAATAATAEAAVATAKAAMEIVRLTRPAAPEFAKENWAAVIIQTSFRGYLDQENSDEFAVEEERDKMKRENWPWEKQRDNNARRALRALKGLVKLQALVRGHNVRKQAKLTLQCMQALVRVQDRIREQRARLSHESSSRKSVPADPDNLWESSYLQDIRERKSISRNTSCVADFWDKQPPINEMLDVEAMPQNRKDAVLHREKSLSQAFSQQMWRSPRIPSLGGEEEFGEEKVKWLDRWMASKQWEIDGRYSTSTDRKDNIKTVEIDTSRPYSYSVPRLGRRSASYNRPVTPQPVASPLHWAHHHSPATPSPAKARPIQVRSASPRCYSAATTPSLAAVSSQYWLNPGPAAAHRVSTGGPVPNYMAATESARARARSQSAPRQRPATPERDSAARKRLSYPDPEGPGRFGQNLRSPSFKSAHYGFYGMEPRSNVSGYTESLVGGEISPCSTTDLRWFR